MTLSRLAQLANVSLSVASKAFSGKGDVSKEMREHVFRVAREHGCFEQFYRIPYDKPIVAVIIPEVISQYYINYISNLSRLARENGYTILLSIDNFDRQLSCSLFEYYTVYNKVDGLITFRGDIDIPEHTSTATVCMSSGNGARGAYISRDLRKGISESLKHLKENGHSGIGFVGELLTEGTQAVFREEAQKLGLETRDEWTVTSLCRFEEAGRDGIRRIMEGSDRPTAVLGSYGYITKGIIAELSDMGYSVPRDMSVVSVDNDPFPLDDDLDVTYIDSCIKEVCEAAMRLLTERIGAQEPNSPCRIKIPPKFHIGQTVYNLN